MPVGFLDLLKKGIVDNPIFFCIIPDGDEFFRPFALYLDKNFRVKFCLVK